MRRTLVNALTLSVFALIAANLPAAHAGTMLSPAAVLGTDLGTSSPQTPLENMINQTGLDKPFTSGVTDFDDYFNTGASPFAQALGTNNWQSDSTFSLPLTGFVDFDLGDSYTIDRLGIWNITLATGDVLVSDTLGGPFVDAGDFTLPTKVNFPFSYQPEIVTLTAPIEARYLRLGITSAHKFAASDTFTYAIVGELVVDVVNGTFLPADFDEDGQVNADDLATWQTAFGATDAGDADLDGDTDGADFLLWQQQFGATPAAAAIQSVPEPATLALLAAAILGCHWHPASEKCRKSRPLLRCRREPC
jgi:hypothetical protein